MAQRMLQRMAQEMWPFTPTASLRWAPKPASASCSCCSPHIRRAWWSAIFSPSSAYPIPPSLTIWRSSRMRAWSRSAARAPISATPPTPKSCRSCCSFFTPNVVPVTKPLNQQTLFSSASRNGADEKGRAMSDTDIKKVVKEKYGQAALRVTAGGSSSCCGASAALDGCCDPITSNLYDASQTGALPQEAVLASLGCGNPTALANLRAGDVVLDLGSGGGIDVLLSARRVGPTGKAYGLDMTDAMLELARRNAAEAGVQNVAFLQGEIAAIPLP